MLVESAMAYGDNFALHVCRNPRPASLLSHPGAHNQFSRSLLRPTPLEQLDTLTTTVLQFRPKNNLSLDKVGEMAAVLVGRLGVSEYSTETSGTTVAIRIHFQPSPLRRFGGPDQCRSILAKLEEHFRFSMTPEEKQDMELLTSAGPELFDAGIGALQYGLNNQAYLGRWIYAPSDQPDPVVDQMLNDLHAGKSLKVLAGGASSHIMPRTEGLLTAWDEHSRYNDEDFVEGNGVLPKGALKIESEEGKQAKGQIETLDALAREVYLTRCRSLWAAPVLSKSITNKCAGARPGEVWLMEGNSVRAVQDWLAGSLEAILRKDEILAFWSSARLTPAAFLVRGVERLSGKAFETIENISDLSVAGQALVQYRAQFKRSPVLYPQAPGDSASQLMAQIGAFRHSDDALSHMQGLVILDGLDTQENPADAITAAKYLASESAVPVWLAAGDTVNVPDSVVDVRLRLILGEPALREWAAGLGENHPETSVSAQVLPRLYPETAGGRIPCVVTAESITQGWSAVAYHMYYPGNGRFQNIVPKTGG
jgi:hypothetical protein